MIVVKTSFWTYSHTCFPLRCHHVASVQPKSHWPDGFAGVVSVVDATQMKKRDYEVARRGWGLETAVLMGSQKGEERHNPAEWGCRTAER